MTTQRSGFEFEVRPADSESDAVVNVDLGNVDSPLLVLALLAVAAVPGLLLWRWMRGGEAGAGREAPRPAGGVLRLVDSPIRVMRWWASGPRRAGWALLPVALHAAAVGLFRLPLLGLPLQVGVVGAALVAIGSLASFAAHAAAVVVIYLLAASQPGRARRLVEVSALVYWTQLVWSGSAAALVFLADDPANGDLAAVVDITGQLWGVWLIGLHAAALHVVSGFSPAGAWGAGVALCALFFGVPALGGLLPGILS